MGKPNAGASDLATLVAPGTLGSATAGNTILAPTNGSVLNVSIWGTFSATAQLERSFDGGSTWLPVSRDIVGAAAVFTAAFSLQVRETEAGVLYRINCTAYTSGTINYRLSY